MNIRICITSNISFSEKTLPIIIPSLINSGVNSSDIFFIEGGYTTRTTQNENGITHIRTNQNSVEYTSLIDIVEYSIESDYWVLLHDTCRVGPNFSNLIKNIPNNCDKVALKHWPSMSIGAYKYEYLMKHRDRLMAIKNTDYSRESIQYWKQWGIHNEDYMLWREDTTPCHLYNPHLEHPNKFIVCDEQPWYPSAINRRVEYYSQLDVYKSKANWEPKKWMEIDV